MIFKERGLKDAYLIEIDKHADERGFFARTWCRWELESRGLNSRIAQCSTSWNAKKGTLRGIHYQIKPFEEAKLVRCTRGAIYDVIGDLRLGSPSFAKFFGIVLEAAKEDMLYVPEGFAQGFLALEDDTEVHYQISEFYSPEHARGFRWNDPLFSIKWPEKPKVISERDKNCPDFSIT